MRDGGDPSSVEADRAPASSVAVSLVVAASFFMQNLDGAILNTSLPQMAASLKVNIVAMNAVVTAYILAVATFMPISGWLAERLGAKRVFAAAVAIFTLASVACAMPATLPHLVAARLAQGVGGALMVPIGRVLVLRSTKPSELLRATALLVWPALFAPIIGPVLGGAITSFFGWRWNFLLNLPIGIAGVVLILTVIPDVREHQRKPLDTVGALLSGAASFLLIYGLNRLTTATSLMTPIALVALGAALIAGSAIWFRSRTHPLLDLAALRIRTFSVAAVEAGGLLAMAVNATPFLLPLMLQQVWGLSPIQAGWWLLVYFLGNLAMKTLTTPILRRFGFRPVLLVTGLGIAVSIAACGFLRPSTAAAVTGAVLFAAGATRSMQFTAISTLSFADVPPYQTASATTLSGVAMTLASALGIAFAAVALNLSRHARGAAALSQADFQVGFVMFGLIAAAGTALCLRLAPGAGAEVSGHRQAQDSAAVH